MKIRLITGLFILWQLFVSTLVASPIFDRTNPNLWLLDETTGQMSGYRYQSGAFWLEDFRSQLGVPVYNLQSGEQALINNLESSSQLMNSQLAPISLAGLGFTGLVVGSNTGMQPLQVSPASGDYAETIMVEMAVNVNLTNEGPVFLKWDINGVTTGISSGSATITPGSDLRDGRLHAHFYLVKNDDYNVTVRLLNTAQTEIISQDFTYKLLSSNPDGDRRDTDNDGLPDLVEQAIGLNPLDNDWQIDSDNNGWSDFDEWLRSADIDPATGLPRDTDNDGWSDFDEDLRGTNANDLVQALVSADAPIPGSLDYQKKLRLFQDIPAVSSLYEVEYVIDVTAGEIQPDTQWRHFSSYIPGTVVIFDSDELLTIDEISWADAGSAAIPARRTQSLLGSLITNNQFSRLRLPASYSQILDIRGLNSQIVTGPEGDVEEIRNWHLLHWLNTQADLTPLNFDAGNSWNSAEEWKAAFISYLDNNLDQTLSLQMNLDSTTDTSLMLTVLATEYQLAGGLDLPVFDRPHGMSQLIFEDLKDSLAAHENERILDDVFIDLLVLSAPGKEMENSRNMLKSDIAAMDWKLDSLSYLSQLLAAGTAEIKQLVHLSRLALFADGVTELAADATLSESGTDSDSDNINNQDEILGGVFANALYPWNNDSDGDFVLDDSDACPLDEQNLCLLENPVLTLSGPGAFNVTMKRGEGDYVVVTVQLNRAYEQNVSVDFNLTALVGDSAVAGEDFEAMSGTLFIPAGETSATIIVNLLPQSTTSTETFHLVLSNEQNAALIQTEYLITVEVELNDNPNLQSLNISSGSLDPAFSTFEQVYDVSVDAAVMSMVVTPTAEDPNATIEVDGVVVASGAASQAVALAAGSFTNISVKVTADNGLLSRTYTIRVYRPVTLSNNADLSNLSLSAGSLSPAFDAATLNYAASVSFTASSITVTPTAANGGADITVNGSATLSGSASSVIDLIEGENTVDVVMLAEDGVTTQTYRIIVTRSSAGEFVQQAFIKSADPDDGDYFGTGNADSSYTGKGIALSGDTLAVSVVREDSNSSWDETNNLGNTVGAVYIFVRDNNDNWTQQAYIKATIRDDVDKFGSSLDLDGDTLVVGAVEEDSQYSGQPNNNSASKAGAAYVFTRSGTSWSQQAYLKADYNDASDQFGISVAVSGDTIAVGSLEDSAATDINGDENNNSRAQSGAVFIFTRDAGSWSKQAYIKASNANIQDWFGISVALDGDSLAVGANTDTGAAYIYTRSGTTWTEQAIIKADNAGVDDQFGLSVSLSGDTLVVGAPKEDGADDNTEINSGAAYVFTRSGTVWSQQAYLRASNAGELDGFGGSVSVSGNAIVVGAAFEKSISQGINSDQTDDNAAFSGAAYVFLREGANWAQHAYVKASNSEAGDQFGINVAIEGETIAVGSLEDSSASGINGNEDDNFAPGSGAVYIIGMPVNSNTPVGTEISSGWDHSCAIIDGSVRCFGVNTDGQLDVPALVNPRKISSGQQHSCAIDDTGVVCWGSNSNGQSTVPALSNPVEISTGGFHSCAIDDNGVTCWGYSLYGQANHYGTNANLHPRKLSLGTFHTCWVDDNGVYCNGDTRKGQSTVPGTLVNPIDVSAGNEHTCAIDDNGVTCWGSSVSGYFNPTPVLVNPTEITAGANLTCALDDTGVVCWGFGYTSQLIIPASFSPEKISAGSQFACAVVAEEVKCWSSRGKTRGNYALEPPLISAPIQVSLGRYHGCVLDGSGVQCWGSGTYSDLNTLIPELLNPFEVSAGGDASCALDDTGVVCWPDGVSATYSYSESRIALSNPRQLSVGGANACVLEDAGVVCWGAAGVLSTDVPALVNPSEVQVGFARVCAIDDTGLVCWGSSFAFGLPVDPLSNPHALTVGNGNACVIDDSGAVCWGDNNGAVSYNSVPPLSNPTQISMGQNTACALDDTGVVCWGSGYAAGSTPVLLNPQRVDVGENAICATDDTGMVCW